MRPGASALPPMTDRIGGPADSDSLPTTEDAFLGGRLMIRQPKTGLRAGLDAVFLAAACPAKAGDRVLEAGAGSGIVSLAVASRVPGVTVAGVEIDPALAALANANAAVNGFSETARFIVGDVTRSAGAFADFGVAPSSFDHVLANPPFLAAGEARLPPDPMLRRAHAVEPGEWEGWVRFLTAFARPKGTLTLIHRADALPRLLPLLERRFGSLILFPLFPRRGEAATRILIQGVKGRKGPVQIREGLVLHHEDGGFTETAQAVLREGARLELHGSGSHVPERTA
jgi:tRNA1(Val) A37 N6-methylase TrmN6